MPAARTKNADYEKHKARARERVATMSAAGRDIGPIPPLAHPRKRKRCEKNFEEFCLTYLPGSFLIRFSEDHRKVIRKIEQAVLTGGLFAVAMPRGSGKSTLSEAACLWALLFGHRSFIVLVGAETPKAEQMLESIKVELETNELLLGDFPEVCYPIVSLDRIAQRVRGQTCQGEPTYMTWSAGDLVLPTIKDSKASGAVVATVGITASIRGLKHKKADGTSIRPDLVIIDDPQTDESSRSASQCEYRKRILAGAILGLAGPGKKISGIMPCTVITPGDVADELLDATKHPEWNGERTRLLYSWPTNRGLWDTYRELRAEGMRRGDGGKEATEYYRENRQAMDEGAVVAWEERKNPDEISAIQHCMNLWMSDPVAFAAEYQNDPVSTQKTDLSQMDAGKIAARVNNHARGLIPSRCNQLTASVDIQKDLLYWTVCSWETGFTGAVIDYGTWPDQKRPYFQANEAGYTIGQQTGIATLEGSLFKALDILTEQLLGREWNHDGGSGLQIGRLLIDSGWGIATDLVYRFCRQTRFSGLVLPSKGVGIGARNNPMSEWPRHIGEIHGQQWVIRPPQKGRPKLILFDTNFWKTFVAARLCQSAGETGELTLYGDNPGTHRLFADHMTSEYRISTEGRGRKVEEWMLRPERPDNHWLDCLVGCAVAASSLGVSLAGVGGEAERNTRSKVSWKDMQDTTRKETASATAAAGQDRPRRVSWKEMQEQARRAR